MSRAPATAARRLRQGLTLVEVMVVIAIVALVAAIAVPTVSAIFDLQVRSAAVELGQTYTWLLDEAALRNATFRVAYNLDRGTWQVEVGDPNTLVFTDPEKRQEFERDLEDQMSRFTERELEEGAAEDLQAKTGRFEGLSDPAFTSAQTLPDGAAFAWVYTPQYGKDGARPSDSPPDDPADDAMAYTYIFPSGAAEHTVIRIVDADDPEDGYTVEVSPISGLVTLTDEEVDPEASLDWLPTEGPTLP